MPLPMGAQGARFIGAFEGGWVVLALQQNAGYAVVNLRDNATIPLLEKIVWGGAPVSEPMILRAVAFSCSPTLGRRCVVASIVSTFERPFNFRSLVTFSRFGASVNSCSTNFNTEDVIYFEGSFYFVAAMEDMLRCTPQVDHDAPPDEISMQKIYLHFVPLHHEETLCVKGRYLVESRGELLMVVRDKTLTCEDTSSFSLFRMVRELPEGPYFSWQRVASLMGRMIFVGRGCSRSYELENFPGCQEGVYFIDDDTFNQPCMVAFGFGNGRSYNSHDNGCWPGPGGNMKRWYDWRVPSTYTPPMWFLH